ncbi:HEAT repeat domain-containing protein [Modestobacter sp. I12A-02628]|uniref:HEAT repeat domain-containing protein n=1 Tax=Goekera deserti TaxID=2497753 RepID=A0A7K3WDA6_9ACTN|nr:HEAT repeat domain-containing protein [Goekera deserti]MPQ96948.1 HEAT repeat domain-containing protein [Goekera deserti]NDI46737.1 HEAT repeat domain-containing protein [Goekera deserti]NEL54306.1 HEAT repeat domain-containing protein [Goekera deserti]
MTDQDDVPTSRRLTTLLGDPDPSVRLRAALAAGTRPASEQVDVLVRRCAVEPEFAVRDMLTWALTRHDPQVTVDRLLAELGSPVPQARSQALHTLSKTGDPRAWPALTTGLLQDADDEVARAAWRTAVALVPASGAAALADTLVTQLGRGGRDTRLSLSRALVALGGAAKIALRRASEDPDEEVSAHARATVRLALDPEDGRDAAVAEATRVLALRGAPLVDG